jgi:hypothetical protein
MLVKVVSKSLCICCWLQTEKQYEAAALDVLHSKCAIQDVFADSRFLKQEALQVRQQILLASLL